MNLRTIIFLLAVLEWILYALRGLVSAGKGILEKVNEYKKND